VAVLLVVERRRKLRPSQLFALYALLYGVGRFWVESLRIDDANHILGLRVNTWTSIVLIAGSALYLAITTRRRWPAAAVEPDVDLAADSGTGTGTDAEDASGSADENVEEMATATARSGAATGAPAAPAGEVSGADPPPDDTATSDAEDPVTDGGPADGDVT
jgi:hypothetical protein